MKSGGQLNHSQVADKVQSQSHAFATRAGTAYLKSLCRRGSQGTAGTTFTIGQFEIIYTCRYQALKLCCGSDKKATSSPMQDATVLAREYTTTTVLI